MMYAISPWALFYWISNALLALIVAATIYVYKHPEEDDDE